MKKSKSIIILSILAVVVLLFTFLTTVSLELGIYDYDSIASRIKLGLDVKGGVYAVYNVSPMEEGGEVTDNDMYSTISRLQTLLTNKGYSEAQVYEESYGGERCIRVEVADVDDPETLFSLLGKPAELHFIPMTSTDVSNLNSGNYTFDKTKSVVGSSDVAQAYVSINEAGEYVIALEFTKDGAKKFSSATSANVGKYLSIWLDGECLMTPQVNEAISNGRATITGNYDYATANEHAMKIQSGTFSVKLSTRSKDTISAILGEDALNGAIIAGAIGVVLIFVIMAVVYGMFGLIANIALVIYMLLYVLALAIFPFVQLTLPGIAGIILSIGMAVDANVITFERIKDDFRSSELKTLEQSVEVGYKKSFWAIFDSNVTTILGAIVLWVLGTGTVTGFAVTLILGILLSFFTAVFVTKWLIKCFMPLTSTPKLYKLYKKEETING